MKTDALRVLSILAQSSSAAIAMPLDIQLYPLESAKDLPEREEKRRSEEEPVLTEISNIIPMGGMS